MMNLEDKEYREKWATFFVADFRATYPLDENERKLMTGALLGAMDWALQHPTPVKREYKVDIDSLYD